MDKFWLYLSIVASILSIGVALYLFFWVKKQPEGSPKAKELAS